MPGARLKVVVFVSILIQVLLSLEGEELVFLSNEIGMPLEPFRKNQETPEYRLGVNRSSSTEIKTLLNREGVELKRWETRLGVRGLPLERKEYKEGLLQKRVFFDARGRIVREEEFEAEKEAGTFEYIYAGTTYRGVTWKPSGSDAGYKEEVLYTPKGTYRGVYREYESGDTRISLASQSRGVLQREIFQGAGISFLARYNSRGDAIYQEVRKEGVPIERSKFWYTDQPSYHIEKMEVENLVTGTQKILFYASAGLLEREVETIKGMFLQEVRYTYQEKQLIQKDLRTRRTTYRWEFRYGDDGQKLEEKQYENESLSLHIDFSPPGPFSRIESRYKGESLVMRTYFQEGSEVLVEYYRDGILLRSVKKGTNP